MTDDGRASARDIMNAEMKRTAFQKKAVSKLPPKEVLDLAIEFFKTHGYRSDYTGRPNQVFVMGGKEGLLPRVTGEIVARKDVGRAGVTLVTLDAAGEKLGQTMNEFYLELRRRRTSPAKD